MDSHVGTATLMSKIDKMMSFSMEVRPYRPLACTLTGGCSADTRDARKTQRDRIADRQKIHGLEEENTHVAVELVAAHDDLRRADDGDAPRHLVATEACDAYVQEYGSGHRGPEYGRADDPGEREEPQDAVVRDILPGSEGPRDVSIFGSSEQM